MADLALSGSHVAAHDARNADQMVAPTAFRVRQHTVRRVHPHPRLVGQGQTIKTLLQCRRGEVGHGTKVGKAPTVSDLKPRGRWHSCGPRTTAQAPPSRKGAAIAGSRACRGRGHTMNRRALENAKAHHRDAGSHVNEDEPRHSLCHACCAQEQHVEHEEDQQDRRRQPPFERTTWFGSGHGRAATSSD